MINYIAYKGQVLLALALSLVWCVNPFLSIFLILFVLVKFTMTLGTERYFLLLMSASMGLIAYTAKSIAMVETDVVRYALIFDSLANVGGGRDMLLSVYLDGDLNPGFLLVNFIMAKLFPTNPQVLPFFWVTVTYYFSLLMFRTVITGSDQRDRNKLVFLYLLTLAGFVSFARVTDAIKQGASTAIFGYAIARELMHKRKVWLTVICAILVHISALIMLPVFLSMRSRLLKKYLVVIFGFCLLISFVNIMDVLAAITSVIPGIPEVIEMKVTAYQDYEITSSIRIQVTFMVYFFMVFLLFQHYLKRRTHEEKNVLTMQVVALCILLFNKGNAHNFMRYVYGYAPFYGLAYYTFISYKDWKKNEVVWIGFALAGYMIYANISYVWAFMDPATLYANSYVDNSLFNLLTYTVSDYLNYRVVF